MKRLLFKGQLKTGRERRSFEREAEGESKKHAEEQLLSTLGSEHGVNRSKIEIESIEKDK